MSIIDTAIDNKHLPFRQWSDLIDQFVTDNKLGTRAEVRQMEAIARKIGIDPKPFDCKPYYDFLIAIHSKLQAD